MWANFVELLRAAIFSAAHVCGGSLGAGILLVSAAIRIALLPLTLRLARRAREQQLRLAALKPEIDALQKRYATDPAGLMRATNALYAKHDIKLITPSGIVGFLVQAPILSGLFSAVRSGLGSRIRFLWVSDLARPDGALMLGVAALTAWSVSRAPTQPGAQAGAQTGFMIAAVLGTIVLLWSASSAVTLSWGASSLVSVLQNWVLSRDAKVTARNA